MVQLPDCNSREQLYDGAHNSAGQRDGDGTWTLATQHTLHKYCGSFTQDNLHGEGVYTQTVAGNSFSYEGTLYANEFDGYAKVIHGNGVYFEGLFRRNQRFGPGVAAHCNGSQDVGFWCGVDLMRLAVPVASDYVPFLAQTTFGKLQILKHRKLVPILQDPTPNHEMVIENNCLRNPNGYSFNHSLYNARYQGVMDLSIEVTSSKKKLTRVKKMLSSIKDLDACTPKELRLLQQKFALLSTLLDDCNYPVNPSQESSKTVEVSDLLAWNNEEYYLNVLRHAFKHRKREYFLNFLTSKVVQGARDCFNSPGVYEDACTLFLLACSNGEEERVHKLHKQFSINPDVSDCHGNTGVIFAATRDRVHILKGLVNMGAKLDMCNDENISALNLCLLRCISLNRNIKDWERAFLMRNDEAFIDTNGSDSGDIWKGQNVEDMVTHSYLKYFASRDSMFLDQKDMILFYLDDIVMEPKSLEWFYLKMGLEVQEPQKYQSKYSFTEDPNQTYIFDWRERLVAQVVKATKGKSKPKSKSKAKAKAKAKAKPKTKSKATGKGKEAKPSKQIKEPQPTVSTNSLKERCNLITSTIEVLLCLGVQPNLCEMPLPSIILALYCDNPKLLNLLIASDATITNVYTSDRLNLLHILCLLPPSENLDKLGLILMRTNSLASQHCSMTHWEEDAKQIEGDVDESVIGSNPDALGKTPLHLLATRMDYENDPEGYLNKLANAIATKTPSTLTHLYLGHTPLSLAVLRGNTNLVRTLLETHSDPNKILPKKLGNALTIYCLKRHKKLNILPSDKKCKEIMDLLVEFGGNPLLPIGKQAANGIEFVIQDNVVITEEPDTKKKSSAKASKSPKSSKGKKSSKSKSKAKSKSKSSKKSKSKKKPKTSATDYFEILLQTSRKIILTHNQTKLCIFLFKKILDGTIKNYLNLFQFFTSADAQQILIFLVQQNILQANKDVHYFLALLFMECVKTYGITDEMRGGKKPANEKEKKKKGDKKKGDKKKKKEEKKKKKKEKAGSKKSSKKESARKKGKNKEKQAESTATDHSNTMSTLEFTSEAQLDAILYGNKTATNPKPYLKMYADALYQVCFQCGQRTNKSLVPCPICGLIYFCSEACNADNIKAKPLYHPCNLLFYDREQDENTDMEKDTSEPLQMIFMKQKLSLPTDTAIAKLYPPFMQFCTFAKDPTYSEQITNVLALMGLELDDLKLRGSRWQDEASKPCPSMIGRKGPIESIRLPFSCKLHHPHDSLSLVGTASIIVENLSMAHGSLDDASNNISLRLHPELQSRYNSVGPLQQVLTDSSTNHNMIDNRDWINANDDDFEVQKTIVVQGTSMIPMKHAPKPKTSSQSVIEPQRDKVKVNKKFISTLNKLFPEFDFSNALAPFVVFTDSQFYYKFGEKQPQYFSTHM